MTKEEHIKYWLDSAENDLLSAETLLDNDKYDWALFIAHLILEKTHKAHFVKDFDSVPPKTHNLVLLAEKVSLDISEDTIKYFDNINNFNIEARYPEYKYEFYKIVNKDMAVVNFNKIKDIYLWLKSKI